MTTTTTAATAATTATATATPSAYSKLGESDFLKLLTSELQNQDPTQPVDDTSMIAQLATFSQLSATNSGDGTLTQISDTLSSIAASQQAAQQSAAATAASSAQTAASIATLTGTAAL